MSDPGINDEAHPFNLDPRQAAFSEGYPERFTTYEDAYGTLLIELALIDDNQPPHLVGRENEKYLTPSHPPEEYLLGARIRAFRPVDPKTGHRPKHYKASPSWMLIQEKEVLETTIIRVGNKYHDMQVGTEKLAGILHLDEDHADNKVAVQNRADAFRVLALADRGPVAAAYKRLRKFCAKAELEPDDRQRIADLMDDAFQTNNTERLNRIAKLTLAHEIKRADWFRRIQINFATYRLDRMPFWEEHIDKAVLGTDKLPSLPMLVRDETAIGRRLRELRRSSIPKGILDLTEEEAEAKIQPLDIPEDVAAFVLNSFAYVARKGDQLETYWRKGLRVLRHLGGTALAAASKHLPYIPSA